MVYVRNTEVPKTTKIFQLLPKIKLSNIASCILEDYVGIIKVKMVI